MSAMGSQITGVFIVYSTVCSDQRKHQSTASLAFVRGIHQWPVNCSHKGAVTRKLFPFDDVIIAMQSSCTTHGHSARSPALSARSRWLCRKGRAPVSPRSSSGPLRSNCKRPQHSSRSENKSKWHRSRSVGQTHPRSPKTGTYHYKSCCPYWKKGVGSTKT